MEPAPEIDQAEITSQLNRILNFPIFSNSLLLSGFLKFIVEETLAGRSHYLKEYTVGLNVLSKNSAYDPQSDASVRIHAGRLRRALYSYYNGPGAHDQVLISVPKGSYVPKFEIVSPSSAPVFPEENRVAIKPTLAILPFHGYDDKKLSMLADGLCDQICTELTNFSELAIVSYYSSRKVFSKVQEIKEAAILLDAKYLLTGNIQSSGKAIRINVQLVQSATQHQIWACSYEKEKSALDTFAIQDDIVRHVVNQIAGSHGIIFREAAKVFTGRKLLDIKVYDAVFWYYHLVSDLNEETWKKALGSMKESVKLDSQYALGWAVLSETYVAGFFYQFDGQEADPLDEAVKCGKQAIQIDLRCHHAYQALGLAYLFQHKQRECLQVVEQWLKLKSNAAGIAGGLGFCLICAGEYDRGYTLLHDSIQLNPYYPWWFNAGLSFYHFHKSEFDDAVYWAEKIRNHSPLWERILKTACYSEAGLIDQSRKSFDELITYIDMPSLPLYVGAFLHPEELKHKIMNAITKAQYAL